VGIGRLCGKKLPIYRATINPEAKNSIFVVGGVHGDESGGIEGILEYLTRGKFPNSIRIEFFPIMNPTGFIAGTRETKSGRDINRDLCSSSMSESTSSLIALAKKMKPKLFMSMHEDESINNFYMYYSDHNMKALWDRITRAAEDIFGLADGYIHGDKCINGLISHPLPKRTMSSPKHKCSIENAVHLMGIPYITTETPKSYSMSKRCLFNRKIIDMVSKAYS